MNEMDRRQEEFNTLADQHLELKNRLKLMEDDLSHFLQEYVQTGRDYKAWEMFQRIHGALQEMTA
jgi:regulatory protein YycI of two-component signal transduction system YycFG